MSENKLPIYEFSLNDMCNNPSILIIGKRGTGKTYIANDILKRYESIPHKVIISPTEKGNPFLSEKYPDAHIHSKYDNNILEEVIKRQELILKEIYVKYKNESGGHDEGYFLARESAKALIVLDDCLGSKGSWTRDSGISDLLMNGRHREITYILTMQFPLGIPPEMRCNFDYVFLLAEDNSSILKRLYDQYAGIFPHFDSFRNVFGQLTEEHGAMVIIYRTTKTSFLNKIAHYKAKMSDDTTNKKREFNIKVDKFLDSLINDEKIIDEKISKFTEDVISEKNIDDVVSDKNIDNDSSIDITSLLECSYDNEDNIDVDIESIDSKTKLYDLEKNIIVDCVDLLLQSQKNQNRILKIITKQNITDENSVIYNALKQNIAMQHTFICYYTNFLALSDQTSNNISKFETRNHYNLYSR